MNGGPANGSSSLIKDHPDKIKILLKSGKSASESPSTKFSSANVEKPLINSGISEICIICRGIGTRGTMDRCEKQPCYTYAHRDCLKAKPKTPFYCSVHENLHNLRLFSDKEFTYGHMAASNGANQKSNHIIEEEKLGESLDEENLSSDILKNDDFSDSEGVQLFKVKKKPTNENGHTNGTKTLGSAKKIRGVQNGILNMSTPHLTKRKPVVKTFNDNQIGHFPYKKKSSLGKHSLASDSASKKSGCYRSSKGYKEVSRKKPKQSVSEGVQSAWLKTEHSQISEVITKNYLAPDCNVDWSKLEKLHYQKTATPEGFSKLVQGLAFGTELPDDKAAYEYCLFNQTI